MVAAVRVSDGSGPARAGEYRIDPVIHLPEPISPPAHAAGGFGVSLAFRCMLPSLSGLRTEVRSFRFDLHLIRAGGITWVGPGQAIRGTWTPEERPGTLYSRLLAAQGAQWADGLRRGTARGRVPLSVPPEELYDETYDELVELERTTL